MSRPELRAVTEPPRQCRALSVSLGFKRRCEGVECEGSGLCWRHKTGANTIDFREANRWLLLGGPFATDGPVTVDGLLPEALRHKLRTMTPEEERELWVPPEPENVYFVLGNDMVKIGKAINPAQRLRALQANSPTPLKLARVVTGTPGLEAELHRYFASLRRHFEWFDSAAWECIEPLSDADVLALARSVWDDAEYAVAA